MKNRTTYCSLVMTAALCGVTLAIETQAQERFDLTSALVFHASFDGTTDANLFGDDGWIYTADSTARERVQQGNHCPQVSIAKNAGKFGDALRFSQKTDKVLFYKTRGNLLKSKENWSGTVSFWLKTDPDEDLPPEFCDPIQITERKWNDGAFWVDFNRTAAPRPFRLGVFSDYPHWNPQEVEFEKFPPDQLPMVTVDDPPFSNTEWTHVVFTFSGVNGGADEQSSAVLYLNGKKVGEIRQPIKITWDSKDVRNNVEPAIMLGINYVGDMDDLALFGRALTEEEVDHLFRRPEGIVGL